MQVPRTKTAIFQVKGQEQFILPYDIELNPEMEERIFLPESPVTGIEWSGGKVWLKEEPQKQE